MTINYDLTALTRQEWEHGLLQFKLRNHQLGIYRELQRAVSDQAIRLYTLLCSRQVGKSTTTLIVATEQCLLKPGFIVLLLTATTKNMKDICELVYDKLLEDCPEHLKPTFNKSDGKYTFPNGSKIFMAGLDNNSAKDLRGKNADLIIIDEAGFVDKLQSSVMGVLMPQIRDRKGTILLASTPSDTPAHDFKEIALQCEKKGNYYKITIYDDTSKTAEDIEEIIEEHGGKDSTDFRREYLCEWATDAKSIIIPEFKETMIQEWPRNGNYNLYHKYTAMDLGKKDFTAMLYGYYDWHAAKFILQEETQVNGDWTSSDIAKAIKSVEERIWTDIKGNKLPVYRRICDIGGMSLLPDLQAFHNLSFIETSKEELYVMVNELREFVKAGRLVVSPKCVNTIGCLKYGLWDKKAKGFGRTKAYGHCDHLAALIYLVRNLSTFAMPEGIDKNLNVIDPTKMAWPHTWEDGYKTDAQKFAESFSVDAQPEIKPDTLW
jgi:hypothetical protein